MAVIRGLQDFKSALRGGGARPNLFEIVIPAFPAAVATDPQGLGQTWDTEGLRMLAKAASLPGETNGTIDVPFRGRVFKVSGDKTYEPWVVTIINDQDFRHRNALAGWMQSINQQSDHCGLTEPASYMHNAQVFQLGRGDGGTCQPETLSGTGNPPAQVLAQYRIVDMFPTNISPIELNMESSDQIEEFTVEFTYQYHYREQPTGE
jgi:hypothetical protein